MPTTVALFTALRKRFEPLLSQAIVCADLLAVRPPAGPDDQLTRLAAALDRLADREQGAPAPAGLHESHLAACRLAAYTFADERLLSRQAGWFPHSLQLRRLGCSDGGTRFYTLLGDLLHQACPGQTGLLEHAAADPLAAPGTLLLTDLQTGPEAAGLQETAALPAAEHRRMVLLARRMAACASLLAQGETGARHGLDRDETSLATSARAAAAFLALCLVYGFRGQLYAAGSAPLLDDLLAACAELLQAAAPAGDPALLPDEGQPATRPQQAAMSQKSAFSLPRPGPVFLALVPVLLTLLWYLVCAGLINTLDLPWGNV